MTEKFAPPMVTIRRHAASRVCDVVVSVRGQESASPSECQAVSGAPSGGGPFLLTRPKR
jgi:hypothetical protein